MKAARNAMKTRCGNTMTASPAMGSEFPESPYRKQAEYILALKTQIERLRSDIRKRDEAVKELSEELNRLKQIDMQRRPSRN